LIGHPGHVLGLSDPRHWSERSFIALCSQTTDTSIELYWHDGLLRSQPSGTPPSVHIRVIEEFVDRVAAKMGAREGAVLFEVINRNASAHFIGGIPIGENSERGAVDPYLRLFGQPGLHVMDGSVMPANPGVNPSLMITALAERAMSLWPNKGDADTRPSLGSGYERLDFARHRVTHWTVRRAVKRGDHGDLSRVPGDGAASAGRQLREALAA
jgi:cholesterol oxidase